MISRRITAILRSAQEERGLSIRALEAASGVNRGRVFSVLGDEQPILSDELDALAEAVGLVGWKVMFQAETGEPYPEYITDSELTLVALRSGRVGEGPLDGQGAEFDGP